MYILYKQSIEHTFWDLGLSGTSHKVIREEVVSGKLCCCVADIATLHKHQLTHLMRSNRRHSFSQRHTLEMVH